LSHDERKNYIKKYLPETITITESQLDVLVPVITERMNCFSDIVTMASAGELDYYISAPEIDLEKLSWKGEGNDLAKQHITEAITLLTLLNSNEWNAESVKTAIWAYAETAGRGNVLWPIRFALSGRDKSPDPFTLAAILGKGETIARLTHVCRKI
jgi:glutamyl/glutaminyl-tRNA synthetase